MAFEIYWPLVLGLKVLCICIGFFADSEVEMTHNFWAIFEKFRPQFDIKFNCSTFIFAVSKFFVTSDWTFKKTGIEQVDCIN